MQIAIAHRDDVTPTVRADLPTPESRFGEIRLAESTRIAASPHGSSVCERNPAARDLHHVLTGHNRLTRLWDHNVGHRLWIYADRLLPPALGCFTTQGVRLSGSPPVRPPAWRPSAVQTSRPPLSYAIVVQSSPVFASEPSGAARTVRRERRPRSAHPVEQRVRRRRSKCRGPRSRDRPRY
jgi:hypothetical protein